MFIQPLLLNLLITCALASDRNPWSYQMSYDSQEFNLDNYIEQEASGNVHQTTTTPPNNSTTQAPNSFCPPGFFQCKASDNSKCHKNSLRCDNVEDCPDGEDEKGCNTVYTGCPHNHIVCDNQQCISATFRCNGFNDCGDNTDERDCVGVVSTNKSTCDSASFQCPGAQCIHKSALCDGFLDCPNGEDEHTCPTVEHSCEAHQFQCTTAAVCIELAWVCDGFNDCPDNSDETQCNLNQEIVPDRRNYASFTSCTSDEFKCESGTIICIKRRVLCNGVNDCEDASDEGHFCGACASAGCQHGCQNSPSGAQCTCRQGYSLNTTDQRSCYDVDECRTGDYQCQHQCVNQQGSYECTCAPGFRRNNDLHTCTPRDTMHGSILVLLAHQLETMPLFTEFESRKGVERIPISVDGFVVGMTLLREKRPFSDSSNNKSLSHDHHTVFFGTVENGGYTGRIYSLTSDAPVCELENISGVTSVAIDRNNGNLYIGISAPSPLPGIMVCSRSLRFCKMIVDHVRVHSISIHSQYAKVLYAASLDEEEDSVRSAIWSMNLDGSDKRLLVTSKVRAPVALHVHEQSDTLYWADLELEVIERVHLVSEHRETVTMARRPTSVQVFNNRVYWTDLATRELLSSPLHFSDRAHPRQMMKAFNSPPLGMLVEHPALIEVTEHERSPCDIAQCIHLCLTIVANVTDSSAPLGWRIEKAARCVCPIAYEMKTIAGLLECVPSKIDADGTEHERQALALALSTMPRISDQIAERLCATGELCQNLGNCIDKGLSATPRYSCQCRSGFDGTYCEVDLRHTESSIALLIFLLLLLSVGLFGGYYVLYHRRRYFLHPVLVKYGQDMINRAQQSWQQHRNKREFNHLFDESSQDNYTNLRVVNNPVYQYTAGNTDIDPNSGSIVVNVPHETFDAACKSYETSQQRLNDSGRFSNSSDPVV